MLFDTDKMICCMHIAHSTFVIYSIAAAPVYVYCDFLPMRHQVRQGSAIFAAKRQLRAGIKVALGCPVSLLL